MKQRLQAYLARKSLGGRINQRGNDYENAFACYRIMLLILQYPGQLHLIRLSVNVPAFVDDLCINKQIPGQGMDLYYQLKTSQRLTWGRGMNSLQFDFCAQCVALKGSFIPFKLCLVVSEPGVFISMKKKMPVKIRNWTVVNLFRWYGSINLNLKHNAAFKTAAMGLCAFSESDKLEALAACIAGRWLTTNRRGIFLSEILNGVREMGFSYLKDSIPAVLSDEANAILAGIGDFHYQIVHGYFSWQYGFTDSGNIPFLISSQDFRNIEMDIIAKRPQTFNDLECIISL